MKSEAIIELVRSKAPITAIMGEGQDLRLFPWRSEEKAETPYGTFRRLDATTTPRFDGPSRFDFAPYDFFLYHHDKEQLDELAVIFREQMEGSSGQYGGVPINHVEFITDADDYNDGIDLYEHHIELSFNYRR